MCLRNAFLVFCAFGTAFSLIPNENDLQSRVFAIMDNAIRNTDSIELVDGVSFVKTSDSSPRAIQGNFGTMLFSGINSFLGTHVLRVDLKNLDARSGIENIGRALSDFKDAVEESRGKKDKKGKKQKNLIIPLIIAMKAKLALLSVAMGNVIAAIAAKAILVSKIALILGFMLFLKKLVQNPPKNVEETHIKHKKIVLPQEDPVDSYGKNHDWERGNDRYDSKGSSDYNYNLTAQEMAYRRRHSKPHK